MTIDMIRYEYDRDGNILSDVVHIEGNVFRVFEHENSERLGRMYIKLVNGEIAQINFKTKNPPNIKNYDVFEFRKSSRDSVRVNDNVEIYGKVEYIINNGNVVIVPAVMKIDMEHRENIYNKIKDEQILEVNELSKKNYRKELVLRYYADAGWYESKFGDPLRMLFRCGDNTDRKIDGILREFKKFIFL